MTLDDFLSSINPFEFDFPEVIVPKITFGIPEETETIIDYGDYEPNDILIPIAPEFIKIKEQLLSPVKSTFEELKAFLLKYKLPIIIGGIALIGLFIFGVTKLKD